MSQVSLRKVGTSFVTTIPAELVQELHLQEGQKLRIVKENGTLVLTPISEDLDAAMKAHEEILQRYRAAFQRLADA